MNPFFQFVIRNWQSVSIGILVVSIFSYIGILRYQNNALEQELTHAALVQDSLEAASDSTREIKGLLSDSLRYFERRAIQAELENDQISEELNRTLRVQGSLSTQVDSLQTVVESRSVETRADTIYTTFNFYEEPYTVDAGVTVPPPPNPATLEIDIVLDDILMALTIGCSPNRRVNQATLGIVSPSWATVDIQDIRQEPGVCNPSLDIPEENWFSKNRGKLGIAVGFVSAIAIGLSF